MSQNVLCFLCVVVVLLAIAVFLYLGLSCGAQRSSKLDKARNSYSRAKTWDQKIVFFVFNVIILLKGGFWSFLTLSSFAAISMFSAICGQNPYPFYLELWDRFVDFFTRPSPSPETAPASVCIFGRRTNMVRKGVTDQESSILEAA